MLRRLSISNFKSVTKKEYTFKEGLTLIRGPSGAGKTTIFEAIRYALFGGSLRDAKSKKTKIVLELAIDESLMTIHRERGRDLLTLTLSSKSDTREYKGKEAQSIIEKYFGNEDTWISSSYLIQGTYHDMLASPKYREELLLNILFTPGEITPKDIKEKLRDMKKNIEKEIENIKRDIDSKRTYRPVKIKNIKQRNNKESKDVLIYQRALLIKGNQIISQIKSQIDISNDQLKEFIKMVKILGNKRVKEMIEILSDSLILDSVPDAILPNPELIKKLEILLLYNDQELVNYCINLLNKNRKSVESILRFLKQYSENEINKLLSLDDTKFSDKVQTILNQYKDVSDLLNEVLKYEEGMKYIHKLGIKDIEEIDEYIRKLETRYLTCPKCKSKLILISKGYEMTLEPAICEDESNEASKKLRNAIQDRELNLSPEQIKDRLRKLKEIRSLKNPGVSHSEVQDHLNAIRKMRLIDIFRPVFQSSEALNNEQEIRKIISGVPIFHSLINNFNPEELEIISSIRDLNCIKKYNALHEWRRYMSYPAKREFTFVISNIEVIESTLNSNKSIEDLDREIAEIEEEEEEKKQLKFNIKWEEMQSLKKKLSSIESMMTIVDEAEKEHIRDFIDSLNHYLDFILSKIFENCNIRIDMKEIDMKYDKTPDIKSLSGGEKDRVSFALLWSLHQIRKSGFMLLDECFSSIDNKLKKKCFQILKEFDSGVQVLCILHDTDEDVREIFDDVIDVE
jgi:DNA repair exonuclease SbcCD ATPase subunit